MAIVVQVFLGGIVAIIATICIENLRRPNLQFRIALPHDREYRGRPARQARFLGLELVNKPLPCWARWMSRNAAVQAHGIITFHHLDGQNIFGRAMNIRWSGSPEPIAMSVEVDGNKISIADPTRFTITPRMDIYPGEAERLDVAARFDQEDECYGWSNENYLSRPLWRDSDWKLPSGRYLVNVTIISAGQRCTRRFRLINDVPQKDFRIESALPDDSVRE